MIMLCGFMVATFARQMEERSRIRQRVLRRAKELLLVMLASNAVMVAIRHLVAHEHEPLGPGKGLVVLDRVSVALDRAVDRLELLLLSGQEALEELDLRVGILRHAFDNGVAQEIGSLGALTAPRSPDGDLDKLGLRRPRPGAGHRPAGDTPAQLARIHVHLVGDAGVRTNECGVPSER